MTRLVCPTLMGPVEITLTPEGLLSRISLHLLGASPLPFTPNLQDTQVAFPELPGATIACLWLQEFLGGDREPPLPQFILDGSSFKQEVLNALRKVPKGKVLTYGELAILSGHPGKARAVAGAVASNPLPLLIPCHRIIPAAGGWGNYALHSLPEARGRAVKEWLLQREGLIPPGEC